MALRDSSRADPKIVIVTHIRPLIGWRIANNVAQCPQTKRCTALCERCNMFARISSRWQTARWRGKSCNRGCLETAAFPNR
ncbi:hypothetical protein E2C01_052389 [Portunus trituberculatus]|uniref:Uncharacterized protein n=1 Tax=Portunus trituberculatus TaxID=210409 RepID=A0A5B7GLR9_PORTR|nr:hypothetical protein [Portunus trituberculatus]